MPLTANIPVIPSCACLVIELDAGLLSTHDVYFTAYNRASFPVLWYPLTESRHTTRAIPATGSYLIRVHAKTSAHQSDEAGTVRIRVRRCMYPGGVYSAPLAERRQPA